MAMPAGGAAPAAAAAEEPAAEQTEFDVKLTGFDAKAKIKVIKEVRSITSLGLKEVRKLHCDCNGLEVDFKCLMQAKEFVEKSEKSPAALKQGVTKEEAEEIVAKIKAIGGECEIA